MALVTLSPVSEAFATELAQRYPQIIIGSRGLQGRRIKLDEADANMESIKRAISEQPNVIDGQVTVVIPCHNYARYLAECIASVRASSVGVAEIIVVDDASDDNPQQHCDGVTYLRVENRDHAKTCRDGFKLVTSRYTVFLDADDKLHPQYLENAVEIMQSDREAACVFPVLHAFGDKSGVWHNTDKAKDRVGIEDLELRNWCAAGSVYRSEILRQSLAMQIDRVPGCGCNDWITIRAVCRSGPWHASKSAYPLFYRQHAGQMHTGKEFPQYHLQANLANEIVTIVIGFSGRWNCWEKLRQWLYSQSWPIEQLRLMVINTTHQNLSATDLGLQNWKSSLQIERIDVGCPGLADEERRERPDVIRMVEAAVGGIYNRAIQMVFGEWILFIEDDVIPQQPDTISRLMESIEPMTACVTGLYKHRYEEKAVVFDMPSPGVLPMKPMQGPDKEDVVGSGFGCLLARRSVLSRFGLAGDDIKYHFYDVNVGVRLKREGWKWTLDRTVRCEHLVGVK